MTVKFELLKHKIFKSKIVEGFLATILGSGVSKLILVLATFVSSNLLGKMEFGELSFVRNTLNMILCICALNFTALCTKFTTEAKESVVSIHRLFLLFLFSLFVCIIVGGFFVLMPEDFLVKLLTTNTIITFFKIVGILLPLFMLQPLIEGVLRGLKLFKLIGFLQTLSSVFYLLSVYSGIKFGGLNGALIAVILYYALYSIVSVIILYKKTSIAQHISKINGFKGELSSVYKMILPVFLMSFIDAPIMWFAQVMLSKSGSMESVGSMTAMMQIRNLAMLIPTYFVNTYIAFAGEMNAKKKYVEYYEQYDKIEKLYLLIGVFLFILFSFSSKLILYLYGKEFVSDWPAMIISNLSIPLVMLIGIYRMDLLLKDHQQYLLYISIAWNSVWLLTFYIINHLNIEPLYSFFISQNIGALVLLLSLLLVYRKDKVKLLNYEKKN